MLEKRKASRKGLKRALAATSGMPTNCSFCSEAFNQESDGDSWKVVMQDYQISLSCPACLSASQN